MKKAGLAIVGSMGALALAWLLLADRGRDASADEDAARPAAAAPHARPGPTADLVPAASEPEPVEGAAAQAPAGDGERVAAQVPAPEPEAAGFEVRVVRGDDGTPVAGAEVLAAAGAGAPDDLARLEEWLERRATPRTAGAGGVVRVPSDPKAPTQVVASLGELWGRATLRPPGEDGAPPAVELHPDETLLALVAGEDGAPREEVDVDLMRRLQGGTASDLARARTGADGVARFVHAQAYRPRTAPGAAWVLRVDALFRDLIERELDPHDLPDEPVRLTLPETGAVVVHVLDALGSPWLGGSDVTLTAREEGGAGTLSPFSRRGRASLTVHSADGVARFPRVAAGLELVAGVRRQGSMIEASASALGPRRPGETVGIRLAFGERDPVVSVRVLGLDGRPLANASLAVEIVTETTYLTDAWTVRPRSDAEGRIRLDVAAGHEEERPRTARVVLGDLLAPDAAAVLDLSRDLGPGFHDLGDLQLRPPQTFVRGRVVDAQGSPVADPSFELESRSEGLRADWTDVWQFQARSSPDGSFESQGDYAGERFRLKVSARGHAPEVVEFQPGAELLVRLQAGGSVAGSVLLDDAVPVAELQVQLDPEAPEGAADGREHRRSSLQPDGGFRMSELRPGTYAFALQTRNGGQTLHTVSGVPVDPGREMRDPRLQRIDLRSKVRAFRVVLVPPDGRKDLQSSYRHGPAGADRLERYGWFHGTEVVLLATEEAIDVDLTPGGYVPVRLRDLRGDTTVELSLGLTVRIRLQGARPPEPPYYLQPALQPAGDDESGFDFGAASFDERGEVSVGAVAPGRTLVRWVISRRSGASAIASLLEDAPEVEIDVLPGVKDQVFDVVLPQETLDACIEGLGW